MAHSTIAQPIIYIYPQFEENTMAAPIMGSHPFGCEPSRGAQISVSAGLRLANKLNIN